MTARVHGDPPKPLTPMGPDHPMWERLQRQIDRTGVTIEHATAEALMLWTCQQEAAESRLPRSWTIDNLAEARELLRSTDRRVEVMSSSAGITLIHHHPFFGHIEITAELANALFDSR